MAADKQILSFNCGDQVFGLDISFLREIIENQTLTQIPLMPEHIRGVLNLRGNVVPVIDLKARLWAIPTKVSKLSCILVVEFHGHDHTETLGLLVDSVNEVIRVPADHVEHTPELGAKIRTDFMDGIAKVNDEFIILLRAYECDIHKPDWCSQPTTAGRRDVSVAHWASPAAYGPLD